jgi:hypothetical protein
MDHYVSLSLTKIFRPPACFVLPPHCTKDGYTPLVSTRDMWTVLSPHTANKPRNVPFFTLRLSASHSPHDCLNYRPRRFISHLLITSLQAAHRSKWNPPSSSTTEREHFASVSQLNIHYKFTAETKIKLSTVSCLVFTNRIILSNGDYSCKNLAFM